MPNTTSIAGLRRSILKRKGVVPEPRTKKLVIPATLPDAFPKSDKMKLLEHMFNCRIEDEIFKGTLNGLCIRFKYKVTRSTLSRWRHYIYEQLALIAFKSLYTSAINGK